MCGNLASCSLVSFIRICFGCNGGETLEQEASDGSDNRSDEGGDGRGTTKGNDKKDKDEGAVLAHHTLIFLSQTGRENACQDFFSVQGINGNEVKDCEDDVKGN